LKEDEEDEHHIASTYGAIAREEVGVLLDRLVSLRENRKRN
jgi:hypothetical protein